MPPLRQALAATLAWAAVALRSTNPQLRVFPPPREFAFVDGPGLTLSRSFSFTSDTLCTPTVSERLQRSLNRYTSLARQSSTVEGLVTRASVCVETADESLSADTDYSYDLAISATGTPQLRARSVYGALYAMETFVQLFSDAALMASRVDIHDVPLYSWRGLMIDSGRRFFPVPVVQNLLDTMQVRARG